MIGTSTFDWLLIRSAIFLLRFLAPLCLLYCLAVIYLYGFGAALDPVPIVIESIVAAEALFYLLVYLPYRAYLQRDAVHPPSLSKSERRELFDLCHQNIPDGEAYLQKWFLGAPLEEIKRENVKEFFLWAFFDRGGPPGEDDEELEEFVVLTEELLKKNIEPGRGNATCLRLTLDRVDMLHRTLTWYLIVGLTDLFTYVSLLYYGFHFHRLAISRFFTLFPLRPQSLLTTKRSPAAHLPYWHRKHTSKTKLPILFIHGIGIGLFTYVNFLADLNSTEGIEDDDPDDQVGIIAIEILPISFRITHPTLSKSTMCDEIATILAHHGWDKVVLVSHSYGTVVSTHLLKSSATASLIGPIVLIDPVSILLHLPDVAYNFTRRKPKHANEHQLYYFASMDMGVSHTLSRHFFWSENIFWKEDTGGRDLTVSLSGRDLIVDTESVGRYLTSGKPSLASLDVTSPLLIDIEESAANRKPANSHVSEVHLDAEFLLESHQDAWKHRSWKGSGIDVLWFADKDHAQVFDKAATRRPLLNAVREYCLRGGARHNGSLDQNGNGGS